jgi:hypothetical protein
LLTSTASSASAQNYSFDARRIALGGAGGTPNVASKLVEQQRRYKSVLIPVGLVKLLSDVRVFYPNREDFDFSRAIEYGTSPLHFVFGRSDDVTAGSLTRDMVHAQVQSDLNSYRGDGFDTPLVTSAEGLVAMTWGHTFMLGPLNGQRENLSKRSNTYAAANFPHPGSSVAPPGSFHTPSQVVCRMWARHHLTYAAFQCFRWTTFFLLSSDSTVIPERKRVE